jgi:hypothetical protein
MQLPRQVKIRVRPDGKVEVETSGFVGKSCAELSEYLEKLLAGEQPQADDIQREFTADYYLTDVQEELTQEDKKP